MKVQLTERAAESLKEIYQYYKKKASIGTAQKIKNDILTRVKSLKKFKQLGPIDAHLRSFNLGHRKLTQGNYKIVYRLEEKVIYVTDIFDTRQDPDYQIP